MAGREWRLCSPRRGLRMGKDQVKRHMFLVSNKIMSMFLSSHIRLMRKTERSFGFLVENLGYEVNYCAYLNSMYWLVELWSKRENFGITVCNEKSIALFIYIPMDQEKEYLYLPALVSYLIQDNSIIEMEFQGKIPSGNRALQWYANLLKEYLPTISLAIHSSEKGVIEGYLKYIREYDEEWHGSGIGMRLLTPINFQIDEGWKFSDPCWIKK